MTNDLGTEKEILHYQFVSWPDHGVPKDTKAVLDFVRLFWLGVDGSQQATVVHCSAGVGRTGTFIALDTLMHVSLLPKGAFTVFIRG